MSLVPTVLKLRTFRIYWLAHLAATSGMWFWRTLAPILVYRATNDPRALGLLSLASYGPVLLFSYLGGSLADRFDKRTIAALFQTVSASIFLVLGCWSYFGELSVLVIGVAAVLESVAYALCKPAIQAMIYDIVGLADLTKAVSINTAQYSIAQLVGPVLASLIALQMGEATALFVAAVLYLPMVMTMTLYLKKAVPVSGGKEKRSSSPDKRSPLGVIVVLLVAVALGSIAIEGGVRVLAPQVATDLMSTPSGAGYLISAQALGAILGILVILSVGRNVREMVLFRMGYVLFGLSIVLYSFAPNFYLAVVVAVCMGTCNSVSFTLATAMIHKFSTQANRGRSLSFHSMALLGTRPASGLVAGELSGAYGWPAATRFFSIIAVIPAVVGIRTLNRVSDDTYEVQVK